MSQSTHQDPNAHEVVVPVPKIGDRAPTLGDAVHFPRDKPILVVFLRHFGCPCKSSLHSALLFVLVIISVCTVAEQTFRRLTDISNHHPELHCIAVSQSGLEETDKW